MFNVTTKDGKFSVWFKRDRKNNSIVASIYDESIPENMIVSAVAKCSSKDQFNASFGRKMALSKALNSAGFSRIDRTKFWIEYMNSHRITNNKDPVVIISKNGGNPIVRKCPKGVRVKIVS